MSIFSQTYTALLGPQGAPQTVSSTISRLADRLGPETLLSDRKGTVLALRGLLRSPDAKQEVGERALPGLLGVLWNDVEVDAEIGRAVLEALDLLCQEDDTPQLALKHTDAVLADPQSLTSTFSLLSNTPAKTQLAALQFIQTLLRTRRQVVQSYFLSGGGVKDVVAALDGRDAVLTETLATIQALIHQSPDIQKMLAFHGAFEKLFRIVEMEGGLDGGIVVNEAMTCVAALLKWNTSNQVCPIARGDSH